MDAVGKAILPGGSRTVNVVPSATVLETASVPPCARVISPTIVELPKHTGD
jgi:hypothetical protein